MTRRLVLLATLLVALVLTPAALGSEERPTLEELENEIICPTCHSLLALSDAPVADQIRNLIRERIAAGDTKSEIKAALVDEFGEAVLAAPPKKGFNLLAWVLPFAGIAAAAAVVAVIARRWVRTGRRGGGDGGGGDSGDGGSASLDPDLERRLDEELARFDY